MAKPPKPSSRAAKPPAAPVTEGTTLFSEQTLHALTEKIERGFGMRKAPHPPSEQTEGRRPKKNQALRPSQSKPETRVGAAESSGGNKRDARGGRKEPNVGGTNINRSKRLRGVNTDEESLLLQEILALGGSEEDLYLITDTISDEELESGIIQPSDKSLGLDVAGFVTELGITDGDVKMANQREPAHEVEDTRKTSISSYAGEHSSTAEADRPSGLLAKLTRNNKTPGFSASEDKTRLIFEARPDWHAAPLPNLPKPQPRGNASFLAVIADLKDYATSLLEADNRLYASRHLSSSSSHKFLSTIMSSGTLSDKVSAITLVVQESPVHTTKSLESLLALAKKRSRGQAVAALGALKDLLGVGVVLPADRRLRSFAAQPGLLGTLQSNTIFEWTPLQQLPGQITKAHLVSWAYEDWLKELYFEVLGVLEGWCNDEVEYARSRAVTYVYELLNEKPEQESNLLRLLVNKLGDSDKKIASRTSYLLLQLQTSHPLMKPIIIHSIEAELLLRPRQSFHAKYYAINTLNQTVLTSREEDIASKLLSIYFDLFVALLKKPDTQKETSRPAINRKGQIQGGGAPAGKLANAKASRTEVEKQAGEETTEKMISAVLTGVNRALPFSGSDGFVLNQHIDMLFKITHSSNFNTSIQALMLIQQLATTRHLAIDRFYKTLYESLLDPRLITSSKHTLYLNLLFRAVKSDPNIKRVKAFTKRMLQVATLHQPPFTCGVLYLINELERTFPGLKSLVNDPEDDGQVSSVVFGDAQESAALIRGVQETGPPTPASFSMPSSESYDGRKRDPEHSNADQSCLWESIPFLVHFHPSVSLFASHLLEDGKTAPKPDLGSHSLIHFLDRFIYRNAKTATAGPRGSSIMQPLSGENNRGILSSDRATQKRQEPLNSEAFWCKKTKDVSADEVFFHRYFNHVGVGKGRAVTKTKSVPPDPAGWAGGEDEDEEDEIWQALVDSRPELEGGDEDSDLGVLDSDDSDIPYSASDADTETEDLQTGASNTPRDAISDTSGGEDDLLHDQWDAVPGMERLFEQELQMGESAGTEGKESSRQKRRKLKHLPTFASAEDYASVLDNDEDEDL